MSSKQDYQKGAGLTSGQQSAAAYVDPNIGRIVKIGAVEAVIDDDDSNTVRCLTAAKIDYVVANASSHFAYHAQELKLIMMYKAKEFTDQQNALASAITTNMDNCLNYARQTEIALNESNMAEAIHCFQMIQFCERRDAELRSRLERLRASPPSVNILSTIASMNEVHSAVNAFHLRASTLFNQSSTDSDSDSDDQSDDSSIESVSENQQKDGKLAQEDKATKDAQSNSREPATGVEVGKGSEELPANLGAIVSAVVGDVNVINQRANVLNAVSTISERVARLRREQKARSSREKYRVRLIQKLENILKAHARGENLNEDDEPLFTKVPSMEEEIFVLCESSFELQSIFKSIPASPSATSEHMEEKTGEILCCRLFLSRRHTQTGVAASTAVKEQDESEEVSISKQLPVLLFDHNSNGYYEFLCDEANNSFRLANDELQAGSRPHLICTGRPLAIQQFVFEFDTCLNKRDCVVVSVEEVVNGDYSHSILVRRMKRAIGALGKSTYTQVVAFRLEGIYQHFETMRYFQIDEFTAIFCAVNDRTPSALIYNYDFVKHSLIATHVLKFGILDMTYESAMGLAVVCCADRVLRFLSCNGSLIKEVDTAWMNNVYSSLFQIPYHSPITASYAPVMTTCVDDLIYVLFEYSPRPSEAVNEVLMKHEHWRLFLFRSDVSLACELVISKSSLAGSDNRISKLCPIQRFLLGMFSQNPQMLHLARIVASPGELIRFQLYDNFERDCLDGLA